MSPAEVRQSFQQQAKACRDLGSPFTSRLCTLLAERLDETTAVGSTILAWRGNPTATGDAVALRLASALHGLVLSGLAPELGSAYPPHEVDTDTLWKVVFTALVQHEALILDRLRSAPQTNEVRRCVALLPGFLTIAALHRMPLVLSEIGASAGLNMHWDRFHYRLGGFEWGARDAAVRFEPDWQGPRPPTADVSVADRAACDLNPLDPRQEQDRIRLTSYIWADQTDRLDRTREALKIAASSGVVVEQADAVEWLEQRLASPHPGVVHTIYHTIAWQYLPDALKDRGNAIIEDAGRRATERAPLARLQFEADGNRPGAAISLQIWPSGKRHELGRADFHGRWVHWKGWPGDL